jgi:hypothetical protein
MRSLLDITELIPQMRHWLIMLGRIGLSMTMRLCADGTVKCQGSWKRILRLDVHTISATSQWCQWYTMQRVPCIFHWLPARTNCIAAIRVSGEQQRVLPDEAERLPGCAPALKGWRAPTCFQYCRQTLIYS